VGYNDFLGEIHIPLANDKLDRLGEYKLLPRAQPKEEDVIYFLNFDMTFFFFLFCFYIVITNC
jgi:hypothetical protein